MRRDIIQIDPRNEITRETMREWLSQMIAQNTYLGYLYGYPHKKAYRPLAPTSFQEVWKTPSKKAIFLYLHLPFCAQKCSFCNLFSTTKNTLIEGYLEALEKEIAFVGQMLGSHCFQHLYFGGGTPTYLSADILERLFQNIQKHLTIELNRIPFCVECSPETLTTQHLKLFKQWGVSRISTGIQSFSLEELKQCGRLRQYEVQDQKIRELVSMEFEELNLDLIYGLEGQTIESFQASVEYAISFPIQSLFLYPLYIRPLTPYATRESEGFMSAHAMSVCYDWALKRLTSAGFQQYSLRKFKKTSIAVARETAYECQFDPMIGIGAGARSYTPSLHYSTPWAMKPDNINRILEQYIKRAQDNDFSISHGIYLNRDEQIRRFTILTLLYEGIEESFFQQRFEVSPEDYFPIQIQTLLEEGCIERQNARLQLTAKGRKYSDIVGHLFFSSQIQERIAYEVSS